MAPLIKNLQDRVAVITGASRGIGKGVALELGARGAKVVVSYLGNAAAAGAVVTELEAMGTNAIAIKADVSDPAQIEELFERAFKHFGRIDIVVSNSGIESFEPTVDITPERFDEVFNVNTRGQLFVAIAGYRYMKKKTTASGGRIVLTSSIAARVMGVYDHALYAGSKAAIEGLTLSLATDFGLDGITVNAIAPGGVKTDMAAEVAYHYMPGADKTWSFEKIETAMASVTALKRAAVPKDIAKVVAWLASDDSEWVTGQVILCSGGAMV